MKDECSLFSKSMWEICFANFRLRLMSAPGNRRLLLNPQASWEEVKGHLKDGEMEAREQVVEYNDKKRHRRVICQWAGWPDQGGSKVAGGESCRDTRSAPGFQKGLWGVLQCTMSPLFTRNCFKSNKVRPISNCGFCRLIYKKICLNVFESKQRREKLVFVIL